MMPETPQQQAPGASLRRRLILLGVLAGLVALIFASGLNRYLSFDALAEHRGSLKTFVAAHQGMALLVYVAAYVTAVALSVPGALMLTVLGGLLFGPVIGTVAVVMSATLGACLVFVIARTALGDALARKAGGALSKVLEGFRQDAASYLLFLRLVPVFPFWLVNLAPALAGVPFITFVWTTLIGILPGTAAFVVAGAGADSVLAAHAERLAACRAAGGATCRGGFDPASLVTRELGLALALLGAVALIPVAWRRLASRRAAGNQGS